MSKGRPNPPKRKPTTRYLITPESPLKKSKPSSSGKGGGASVGNGPQTVVNKCVCVNHKCENYKKEVQLKEVNCSEQLCTNCKQPLKPAWIYKTQGKQA